MLNPDARSHSGVFYSNDRVSFPAPAGADCDMISAVDVSHFKCFKEASLTHLGRINIFVGDNGVGKTALLEAIFMALGEGPELALRFRQQRGMEPVFQGDRSTVESAFVSDYFYRKNTTIPVRVRLYSLEDDKRSVLIEKVKEDPKYISLSGVPNPVIFKWVDNKGNSRELIPIVAGSGIQLTTTGEDRHVARYYSANALPQSSENAALFSELDRIGGSGKFKEVFTKEFSWIKDVSLQVIAGYTSIHATTSNVAETLPVSNVSGAINRLMAVFLSLAKEKSIVLVDEIDNGVYFKRHVSMCKSLLNFCREYKSQIFMTTHSQEWLEALIEAAGDDVSDITLTRLERGVDQPTVKHFSGKSFRSGVNIGGEVR